MTVSRSPSIEQSIFFCFFERDRRVCFQISALRIVYMLRTRSVNGTRVLFGKGSVEWSVN